MKRESAPKALLFAGFGLALAYWGWLIFQSSQPFLSQRYFLLADDQMISLAYAKNLAAGHGLVWFPGAPRVEGFSNPLWVLIMAALLWVTKVGAALAPLTVQLLALCLLAANLALVYRLANLFTGADRDKALTACVLTALYFPLNYWSLAGFEVSLLTVLLTFSLTEFLKAEKEERCDRTGLLILGFATLVRLDALCLWAALAAAAALRRKSGWGPALAGGIATLAAALAVQTLARYWYYGEWLPNTYYLKMTGYPAPLRLARGALVLWDFFRNSFYLLPLFSLALLNRQWRVRALPLYLPFAAMCAYSVYVGGDAWEWFNIANRFLVPVMPALFVLLADRVLEGYRRLLRLRRRVPEGVGVAALAALLVLTLNGAGFGEPSSVTRVWWPQKKDHFDRLTEAKVLESVTEPDASIALIWAGTLPFELDRCYVDLLGKNDREIARLPMRTFNPAKPNQFAYNNPKGSEYRYFYPGHLKWDPAYSLSRYQPDIVTDLWDAIPIDSPEIRARYRKARLGRLDMLLKIDSAKIRWDALEKAGLRMLDWPGKPK